MRVARSRPSSLFERFRAFVRATDRREGTPFACRARINQRASTQADMHTTIVVFILSIAAHRGMRYRQLFQATADARHAISRRPRRTGCESLEGKVRDDCIRKTREGGTATAGR